MAASPTYRSIREKLEADPRQRREAIVPVKSEVIEIQPPKPEAEPVAPRCSQLHSGGRPCLLPAVGTRGKCARHMRWNDIYPTPVPFPEDGLGLQEMLGYAVICAIDKRITAEEAHAIAELGRVMEKNLERCRHELEEMERRR